MVKHMLLVSLSKINCTLFRISHYWTWHLGFLNSFKVRQEIDYASLSLVSSLTISEINVHNSKNLKSFFINWYCLFDILHIGSIMSNAFVQTTCWGNRTYFFKKQHFLGLNVKFYPLSLWFFPPNSFRRFWKDFPIKHIHM